MSPDRAIAPIERLTTGNAGLDHILGGGLPARSVNVIAGEPGAGKTMFALQLLFHLARQGKRSLYFTTLSEPAMKLISYMQQLTFFDAGLIDSMIQFVDLGATIRGTDAARALERITRQVEDEEPSVVVIDSFKAIGDLLGDAARSRAFVYDLAVHMAGWEATSLLVGEYLDDELGRLPEFAVADGILRFASARNELTSVREFEVRKLRGANYIPGRHFFEIGPTGVAFYPRVRAPSEPEDAPATTTAQDLLPTGIAGLDELMTGGLPRASATLLQGPTGTGKTQLGLHYLVEGTRRGEPGILFTLEETRLQLHAVARHHGWDLAALESQGLLLIGYTAPVELSTDRFLDEARRHVERIGARRAVLDSLTSMGLGVPSERRFRELVYAMTKHFRVAQVTAMMIMEVPELLGSTMLTGHGLSFAADNILQLRYVEVGGTLERGISVLKARGLRHLTEVRQMRIGTSGIEVGDRYPTLRGVLTGIPWPAEGAR